MPCYPVLQDKRAATNRHVVGTVKPNQARDEVFGQVPNGPFRFQIGRLSVHPLIQATSGTGRPRSDSTSRLKISE
jgi:hypothetical protein